jgi:PPP family 3-phenylpropionic acid transporter
VSTGFGFLGRMGERSERLAKLFLQRWDCNDCLFPPAFSVPHPPRAHAGFGFLSPYLPSLLEVATCGRAIAVLLAAGSFVRCGGPAAGRNRSARSSKGQPLPPAQPRRRCRTGVSAGAGPVAAIRRRRVPSAAWRSRRSAIRSLGAAAAARPMTVRRGFEYGWVRGAGSAAFILGSVLSG